MSYCRWSSDNWKCDIYAYEHYQGWYQIHIAGNRIIGEVPEYSFTDPTEKMMADYKKQTDFMENAKREPIGLPHDGDSFQEPDLESFKQRLLELREIGYKFPDYVLETIDEEMKEANHE